MPRFFRAPDSHHERPDKEEANPISKQPSIWQGPFLAGLLLIAAFLAGATQAAQAPPQITIYSPGANGEPIYGNHLLVQVQVSNFRLDGESINKPNQAGAGHWQLQIDGIYAGIATTDMIMAPNAAMPRLSGGSHHVKVELVDNAGQPLNPVASAEVDVNIGQEMIYAPDPRDPPTIKIILPSAGETLDPAKAYVKVRLNHFNLDGRAANRTNVAGSGHWIALIDGQFAGLSMSEILDLPDDLLARLGSGTHRLVVSLRQNDGTPAPGAVADEIMISFTSTVGSTAPTLTATTGATTESNPTTRVASAVLSKCAAGGQYFEPVGHTLCAPFISYWQKYGGLPQFGYPLTEPFSEKSDTNGKLYTVQYFERARFEYHPELDGTPNEVQLGLLGLQFHKADPPLTASADDNSEWFAATGHNLSGTFRSYWAQNGGLFSYGYPITEPFDEVSPTDKEPYTVQYFERARFEQHDDAVLLGLLGTQLLQAKGWLP